MSIDHQKLDPVQLLIELDSENSNFAYQDLEKELKSRNLSKEQLIHFNQQKAYVLEQRAEKAQAPLSLIQKIEILITPFGMKSKPKHVDENPEYKEQEFLRNAGFKRKLLERKKYQKISVIIWSIVNLLLLGFVLFRFL